MSRFEGYPEGYAPELFVSLRTAPEGGKLADWAQVIPLGDAASRRTCLMLVHGFNNHAGQAAVAYMGLRTKQAALFGLTPEALEKKLGDTHWPGDADWWGVFDRADFLVYPAAVGTAVDAGPMLAAALQQQLPSLERVDFIAHSLGCRVVLETIQELRRTGFPHIGRVCLMAAAVPCHLLEPGGTFYAMLNNLSAEGVPIHVLHSTRDIVLAGAFPPGQALAGEPSFRALGRRGPTADMPGFGSTLSEAKISGAGHSDYWGHNNGEPVDHAVREAGTFLQIGDRPREIAHRREIGDTRNAGEEARGLPEPRFAFA